MIEQLNFIISLTSAFTKIHVDFTVKSTQMEYYNQDIFISWDNLGFAFVN